MERKIDVEGIGGGDMIHTALFNLCETGRDGDDRDLRPDDVFVEGSWTLDTSDMYLSPGLCIHFMRDHGKGSYTRRELGEIIGCVYRAFLTEGGEHPGACQDTMPDMTEDGVKRRRAELDKLIAFGAFLPEKGDIVVQCAYSSGMYFDGVDVEAAGRVIPRFGS